MKNTYTDVHNLLIAQMERLSEMDSEEMDEKGLKNLDMEIKKSDALIGLSAQTVALGELQLKALMVGSKNKDMVPETFLQPSEKPRLGIGQ